ncbi:UNVERIFIED_CONTAM: hypothetical protein GTU68_015118 [Idotea baltica]|nr:hypothetical protein [Idotea baltica]
MTSQTDMYKRGRNFHFNSLQDTKLSVEVRWLFLCAFTNYLIVKMISDVPNGFEAHKLINISLGKIAASRSGRTGASLHKSLLVASVLHKARYVYLEEAHHYHHTIFCPPQGQPDEFVPDPPRAPTPLPEVTVTPVMPLDCGDSTQSSDYPAVDCISEECKARLSDSDSELDSGSDYDPTESFSGSECDPNESLQSRKRRRVTDQETEAAVSSILPKRLKSELESQCTNCFFNAPPYKYETKILCSCGFDLSSCQCSEQSQDDEICNMEVDHITSLVSIFSFNQQQQHSNKADLCSAQAHHQADSVGPLLC